MNFIKEKIINFWSNPEPYVYIHCIGELIHDDFDWFAKTDKLLKQSSYTRKMSFHR